MKKLATFQIEEELLKRLKITATIKGDNLTETINNLIRDYVVVHAASINELMLKDIKKKNQ